MSNATLDRLNHVNSALMLVAGVAAYLIPFPLFLGAYALLGPLHYLTEVSWLHDRNYFSHGKYGVWWLVVLGLVACYPTELRLDSLARLHDPIWIALLAGGVMAFVKPVWARIAGLMLTFFLAGPLEERWAYLFFGLYLPTLIHVFLFTWVFVLYGALKNRSASGFASLGVLTLVAAATLLAPPPEDISLSPYVAVALDEFGGLHREFARSMGWDPDSARLASAMRFIAFAYTYHYLNWFSKTQVIQWHRVGRKRLVTIGALYLGSVGLYVYDYALGLKVLFALSVGHVVLEFPLNYLSLWGIAKETRSWWSERARRPIHSGRLLK